MTGQARLRDLAKRMRLKATYGARLGYSEQDDWQRAAHGYRCSLTYQRRRYSFDYWMGRALTREPTALDCLDSLLSDAQAGESSFDDFCANFGYDADSRKAERLHKRCGRIAKAMRRLLGDDFETFLHADRD